MQVGDSSLLSATTTPLLQTRPISLNVVTSGPSTQRRTALHKDRSLGSTIPQQSGFASSTPFSGPSLHPLMWKTYTTHRRSLQRRTRTKPAHEPRSNTPPAEQSSYLRHCTSTLPIQPDREKSPSPITSPFCSEHTPNLGIYIPDQETNRHASSVRQVSSKIDTAPSCYFSTFRRCYNRYRHSTRIIRCRQYPTRIRI
jgi:hypothetical protein